MTPADLSGRGHQKEEIWLSPMTKVPTPVEMSNGQTDNTNNALNKYKPKIGWDKVLRAVSEPCWHVTPIMNALWEPLWIRQKLKLGKKVDLIG